MGDSWDETSFDVSEADARSIVKNVDSEDLDDELFGGLGKKSAGNQSLLKAMQQSTGKGIFDDEDKSSLKASDITPKKTDITKPMYQSVKKPVAKPTSNDDDLLADLLGDSDYSDTSQYKIKAVPEAKINKETKGVKKQTSDHTVNKQIASSLGEKSKQKGNVLFDADDSSDILGMLDTKKDSQVMNGGSSRHQTPPRQEKSSKPSFDDLINRTSLLKNDEEPNQKILASPTNDFANSTGFTPR